jgi:uncharacterized protein YyaL (SSP411 family)
VLLRLKEDYDGAEPAASSVSVLNLLVLSHLGAEPPTGDSTYAERIELTLSGFSARAAQAGRTVPMMLAALSSYHAGIAQAVIVGDRAAAATIALLGEVRKRYRPTMIQVPVDRAHRAAIAERLSWVASLQERDGRPTAYLCREFACQAPTGEPEELGRQLDAV